MLDKTDSKTCRPAGNFDWSSLVIIDSSGTLLTWTVESSRGNFAFANTKIDWPNQHDEIDLTFLLWLSTPP